MLGEALSYPRRGENWLKTVLIGGLLAFFSFLLIPAIPLQGYYVRVLGSAAADEGTPPAFEDWGGLFVDGFKAFVVVIAYLLVPYAVLIAGTVLGTGDVGGSAIGDLLTFLGFVLVVLGGFVSFVALTNLALEDRFGAAFDFGTVFPATLTGRYVLAAVLAVVVGVVLGFLAGLLTLLIVGIFLSFYVQVSFFYLLGTGCGPALREQRTAPAID